MYKVGFGDCFLLLIPTDAGTKKMLIDCGSLKNHKKRIAEIASRVIEDIRDSDGIPRIDILVVSHRHADHISGFANPEWSKVEVGEVWMPWTESPTDGRAIRLRESQTRVAAQLHRTLLHMNAGADLLAVTQNALSNDGALDVIHRGFRGSPIRRFLPNDQLSGRTLQTNRLPGVTVFVLGPPRDEAAIRSMDPGDEGFLALDTSDQGAAKVSAPFSPAWIYDEVGARLDPSDEDAIRRAGEGFETGLAARLDTWLNNTSLILMLQIGNKHFLFPGDAQWGPWELLLGDPETRRLLAKTNFYKVGHHGSHNATPVSFVEDVLTDGKWAMISVTPYGKWKDIPRKPLVDKFRGKGIKLAISNEDKFDAAYKGEGDWWIQLEVPVVG
jgi:beta-lactamase superfamily II metal-dependent hydrolase